tara:strand:- start:159 stop:737 length:579 start_codon:yes stop_codon:yes gene_type:complete
MNTKLNALSKHTETIIWAINNGIVGEVNTPSEQNLHGCEKMKEENYESEEMPLAEWNKMKRLLRANYKNNGNTQKFWKAVWNLSTNILDCLEVSVIIDRDEKLFISKGTSSFVDYKNESVKGMTIPIKCWIHTHPFGKAYFSSTDWNTLKIQRPILDSAIVLGNGEYCTWEKEEDRQILRHTSVYEIKDSEE